MVQSRQCRGYRDNVRPPQLAYKGVCTLCTWRSEVQCGAVRCSAPSERGSTRRGRVPGRCARGRLPHWSPGGPGRGRRAGGHAEPAGIPWRRWWWQPAACAAQIPGVREGERGGGGSESTTVAPTLRIISRSTQLPVTKRRPHTPKPPQTSAPKPLTTHVTLSHPPPTPPTPLHP